MLSGMSSVMPDCHVIYTPSRAGQRRPRGAHCGSQGGSHRDGGEARSEMARMAATMEHDEDAEKLKLGPGVLLSHHAICAHDTR